MAPSIFPFCVNFTNMPPPLLTEIHEYPWSRYVDMRLPTYKLIPVSVLAVRRYDFALIYCWSFGLIELKSMLTGVCGLSLLIPKWGNDSLPAFKAVLSWSWWLLVVAKLQTAKHRVLLLRKIRTKIEQRHFRRENCDVVHTLNTLRHFRKAT